MKSNITKEECLNAFMNLSFSVGTKKCDSELTCDECLNMCGTRLNYEKNCITIKQLINDHFDNQLTPKEIDFLLMSEEERVNTYKNCDEIWKSCVRKLERQKEMLTMNKMKEVAKLLGVEIGEKFNIVEATVNQYYLDGDKGLVNANNFICNDRLIKLLNGEEQIEKLPFKPSYDEDYFCISGDEKIEEVQWDDNMFDYYCYNAKNCFRTEEEITQEDIDRTVKQMKGLYEECN